MSARHPVPFHLCDDNAKRAILLDRFGYDRVTGCLGNDACVFGWIAPDGRHMVKIDGRKYVFARVVWYFHHRRWPVGKMKHIDGNKANNRIANLLDRPSEFAELRRRVIATHELMKQRSLEDRRI